MLPIAKVMRSEAARQKTVELAASITFNAARAIP
jgi:hypothetical protein